MRGKDTLVHVTVCMIEQVSEYHIAGFFRGEIFHESIAIRENFILKMLTESILSVSSPHDLSKFIP